MILNRSPDLTEITVFNVLTIFIQGKQATPTYGHIYQWIVTFVPNYFKIGPELFDKHFLRFHYKYTYKENKLRPLTAMFSMDLDNLTNLIKGSPKEHLIKRIFKSGLYLWTRRFLKQPNFSLELISLNIPV